MTEVIPQFLDTESYVGKKDRQHWRDILTEGIVGSDSLEVTEKDTPDMSVDVAAGVGYVQGDQSSTQGHYRIYNDDTVNKAIAAADPSNDRIDRVIAQVKDSTDIGGADDEWEIQVLTGTPAGSPSAPALPDDALDLALIDVGAGVVTITNSDITDQRVQIDLQNCISDLVTLAGEQTISGQKTLSDDLIFSGNKIIQTNVKSRAYLSSDQLNIAHATATQVLLDAESYDVGSDFASNKFTVPVNGYYIIFYSVTWKNGTIIADKRYMSRVIKNGVDNLLSDNKHSSNTAQLTCSGGGLLYLEAGYELTLECYHDAGENTPDIVGTESSTYMTVHLISV